MIKLAKTLEVLEPSKLIVHGQTVKKISEHELVSVVITLTPHRIYNHEKRLARTPNGEVATALQHIPKAEMMIGVLEEKSEEVILLKVKEALTQSRAEEDMCPVKHAGTLLKR